MTSTHIEPEAFRNALDRADQYRLNLTSLRSLIILLNAGGSLSMTTLARKLDISTAAFTGTADSIERLGFVERQPSVSDRRVIWLNLTARGRDALSDILDAA